MGAAVKLDRIAEIKVGLNPPLVAAASRCNRSRAGDLTGHQRRSVVEARRAYESPLIRARARACIKWAGFRCALAKHRRHGAGIYVSLRRRIMKRALPPTT